jgi:LppP/LprE lipoprotein
VLSSQQIALVMTTTVEVDMPSEHFQPAGPALTIADGMGGTVTAVAGQRVPTADAHGQLVFFWHNTTFIRWDADYESVNVLNIASPGDGTFVVTYPSFAVTDAVCGPSRGSTTRSYQWDGQVFRGNLPPPAPTPGGRVSVKLTS